MSMNFSMPWPLVMNSDYLKCYYKCTDSLDLYSVKSICT